MSIPLSASLFAVLEASASEITSSSICYMQLASDQLIDLTSICGSSSPSRQNTVYSSDDAYLEEVQNLLGSDSDENQVLQSLRSNPGLLTSAARDYCNARLAGMSEQDIYEEKFKELERSVQNSSPGGLSNGTGQEFQMMMTATSVASRLASRIYCPNLTD